MKKRIHIISFDVPYPADYGGVIDVFSRIKWFSENGWKVILHCFAYKRPQAKELEQFAEVHYYSRPLGWKHQLSKLPYIVKTRINTKLDEVLKNTSDVVLLEGLHCAHYLHLQPGKFYLRTHNIEHEYYAKLAEKASFIKQVFYRLESKKLKDYEPILKKAKALLVISENELGHFQKLNENACVVPPTFKFEQNYQKTEPFVLFHGNLSVEENEEAAFMLLKDIVPNLANTKWVFAGKNPTLALQKACRKRGVQLVANPSAKKMEELLNSAQVHLLWTKNDSGLKIKFLNAMATSGHVVCTPEIVQGSNLNEGFHLVRSNSEIIIQVHNLLLQKLEEKDWQERRHQLIEQFGDTRLKDIFS